MCETAPGSELYEPCLNTVICVKHPPKHYVDWSNELSLHNWAETLDLKCVPDYLVQRISSIYYIGEIFGCFLIARIPDLIGRKWPITVCMGL